MSSSPSKAFSIRKATWVNQATFPDIIYIDANPALDILFQRTYGQLVEDYWAELVRRDGMITWSPYTIDEILNVLHTNKYIQYADANSVGPQYNSTNRTIIKPAWKVAEDTISKKDSIQLASQIHQEVNSLISRLQQYGLEVDKTNENEVRLLTTEIYKNCGGSFKDAKHVAFANLNQVNNIMSHDPGFLRIPGQNVFGATASLLNHVSANQTSQVNFIDLGSYFNIKSPEQDSS